MAYKKSGKKRKGMKKGKKSIKKPGGKKIKMGRTWRGTPRY